MPTQSCPPGCSLSRLRPRRGSGALAQTVHIGRLTGEERRSAGTLLDELWDEFEVVEVDELLVGEAADLAQCYALRGYDAVHCASAQQLVPRHSNSMMTTWSWRQAIEGC